MRYERTLVTTACALFFVGLLSIPQGAAEAAKLAGVEMASTQKVGEQSLVLNGLGLRKKAIFKVYVGGLYLTAKSSDPSAILAADEPRRLIMQFVRKVDADSIIGGWNDCLENNVPDASSEVKQGFQQLNSWMANVKKGDQLIFTYEPASGVSVDVAGSSKGAIAGKPFGDALFSCWIGDVPPSADFKKGLLGG